MFYPSVKTISKFALGIALSLSLVVFLFTGCKNQKQASTVYHSENYGFSLSIPNKIYEELIIEDEPETNMVVFCHYHETEDEIPIWGHFFRVHRLPASSPAPENEYDSVYTLLTKDDQYSYYFWYLIPEQCASDPLREIYEPLFEPIKQIPGSFVLDE